MASSILRHKKTTNPPPAPARSPSRNKYAWQIVLLAEDSSIFRCQQKYHCLSVPGPLGLQDSWSTLLVPSEMHTQCIPDDERLIICFQIKSHVATCVLGCVRARAKCHLPTHSFSVDIWPIAWPCLGAHRRFLCDECITAEHMSRSPFLTSTRYPCANDLVDACARVPECVTM